MTDAEKLSLKLNPHDIRVKLLKERRRQFSRDYYSEDAKKERERIKQLMAGKSLKYEHKKISVSGIGEERIAVMNKKEKTVTKAEKKIENAEKKVRKEKRDEYKAAKEERIRSFGQAPDEPM